MLRDDAELSIAEHEMIASYTSGLNEAVQVNALFNMMNRIIEGTGVSFDYDLDPDRHPAKGSTIEAQRNSYKKFGDKVHKS